MSPTLPLPPLLHYVMSVRVTRQLVAKTLSRDVVRGHRDRDTQIDSLSVSHLHPLSLSPTVPLRNSLHLSPSPTIPRSPFPPLPHCHYPTDPVSLSPTLPLSRSPFPCLPLSSSTSLLIYQAQPLSHLPLSRSLSPSLPGCRKGGGRQHVEMRLPWVFPLRNL